MGSAPGSGSAPRLGLKVTSWVGARGQLQVQGLNVSSRVRDSGSSSQLKAWGQLWGWGLGSALGWRSGSFLGSGFRVSFRVWDLGPGLWISSRVWVQGQLRVWVTRSRVWGWCLAFGLGASSGLGSVPGVILSRSALGRGQLRGQGSRSPPGSGLGVTSGVGAQGQLQVWALGSRVRGCGSEP